MADDFIRVATAEDTCTIRTASQRRMDATAFGKSRGQVEGGAVKWVTIHGLQSDVGKKLNGRFGKVLTQQVNKGGRHQVQVEGIQQIKLIQPSNLTDVPATDLVRVYRIGCLGEGGSHEVLIFPKQHQIFENNPPEGNSPAMSLCGYPLMVMKTKPRKNLEERMQYDNVWATWLMIEPKSGFASDRWQSYVGPVYVFRPNGCGDVSADDMDATNEFLSALLDCYGEVPSFNPRKWLNPGFFYQFILDLQKDRQASRTGSALEDLTLLTEEYVPDQEMAAMGVGT